jgi:hypothetical protein
MMPAIVRSGSLVRLGALRAECTVSFIRKV